MIQTKPSASRLRPVQRALLCAVALPALLASSPHVGLQGGPDKVVLGGELPSPLNPPTGCVFSTRCPHVTDRCRAERPQLREVAGRQVACHYAENFLTA